MKILIAEDDPNIRFGLAQALKNEGYELLMAENGAIALELFQAQSPDFIILDIMMPVMDGYTVCKEIRKVNEQIPILFLSAKDEEIDRVVGLELGADDYIGKPFGIHEIRARIKAIAKRCCQIVKKEPEILPSSFKFGEWLIQPNQLTATKRQEEVVLTLREVTILEYFHAHPNEVITRDALFNIAWGYDHLPNSRTLDQHISKLRKIIEPNPHVPTLILTVHGLGYRYTK
ncbi:response regulator transcription factor [Wohlfahrtiimonas populi]|uniref:response regulator transcription factor n=1 Tax=Wohlfahrtiimonas populi TaxID=1940240 RepID=UPI00098D6AEB|nr:response regulator transcription factor [Wohlfahrtiimonas populi]